MWCCSTFPGDSQQIHPKIVSHFAEAHNGTIVSLSGIKWASRSVILRLHRQVRRRLLGSCALSSFL
jgi:hypothetical protein